MSRIQKNNVYRHRSHFVNWLIHYLCLIAITIVLVMICYNWVDKPVVYFVDGHQLYRYSLFYWMQRLPEIGIVLIPILYLVLLVRWHYGYGHYQDRFFLALICALLITMVVEDQLKFIFGRYWPDTYIDNNLSLLKNGAYGFNWFHSGNAYRSFPSGHTATIVTAMTVLWQFYPHLCRLAVLACALVIIGLIGMRYHFVSDIIAGACVGLIIGDLVCRVSFAKL